MSWRAAILRIWPEAQFAAGPPVENGFYYDLEMDHHISPADFDKIEAEMKKVVKENQPFERIVVSRDEALGLANEGRLGALGPRAAPSKFKLDILQGIPDERRNLFVSQRRLHRSLRGTARHADREHRRVQTHLDR